MTCLRRVEMTIRVMYHDGTCNMISAFTLEQFIRNEKIKMFYRYSEEKWINIGVDPIRMNVTEGQRCDGAERRIAEIIASQLT
jgi:hypothetical protein